MKSRNFDNVFFMMFLLSSYVYVYFRLFAVIFEDVDAPVFLEFWVYSILTKTLDCSQNAHNHSCDSWFAPKEKLKKKM